jgi:hypothetical protein
MEQSVRRNQIVILMAGGITALALAAAHYCSPLARRLAANEDVAIIVLNKEKPTLFLYHPGVNTINSVRLPAGKAGKGAAGPRAAELLRYYSKDGAPAPAAAAYIEVKEPDLDAFEDLLNNWRVRPARLSALAGFLRRAGKNGETDLSAYEKLLIVSELSRMNSSNFIKEDLEKNRPAASPRAGEEREKDPPSAGIIRLEVLNAAGRKDLAGRVAKLLRKRGFDVIEFGTYGGAEKRTKIVNCSNDIDAARKVRAALGLGGLEIYSRYSRFGAAQVRVILGEDFDETIIRGMK